MFAVVKIIYEEKTFFNRLKSKFNKQLPKPQTINVREGAPFYYLEIKDTQCGENCENIANILGRCSNFIIPCECKITDNEYIKLYRPNLLPKIMLFNSVADVLKNKKSFAIIDENLRFKNYIERYVNYVPVIKVFTRKPEELEELCESIFEKYGISIIVSNCENVNYSNDVTLDIDNEFIIENINSKLEKLKGNSFYMGIEYEKIRPIGVDKLYFASALYELCGVKKLENLKFDDFKKIV